MFLPSFFFFSATGIPSMDVENVARYSCRPFYIFLLFFFFCSSFASLSFFRYILLVLCIVLHFLFFSLLTFLPLSSNFSGAILQENSCVQTRWRMLGDLRLPWGEFRAHSLSLSLNSRKPATAASYEYRISYTLLLSCRLSLETGNQRKRPPKHESLQ